MFCSKCILKHTEMKHEVIQISPKVDEMKKMIEEMQKTTPFPGTEFSLTSQMKTLLNLVGQQDSELENHLTSLLGDIMKTNDESKTKTPGPKEYNKVV